MNLDKSLAHIRGRVETGLHDFFNQQDFGASAEMGEMLRYHMGWADGEGGKRLRPILTLLCAGAYGGDYSPAMPAAVGIEFLHNFTLIHDDIEDRSEVRHGRPTLWKTWGIAQAINAGDALFSIAQLALLGLAETCGEKIVLQAALEFNQMCLRLTSGQYLDMAFETRDAVSLEDYEAMIRGKTAALISYSAWVGGLCAGAEENKLVLLREFGENLGLAFQIQDDALGIWGDPKVTGKSAASDLLERKKTLPILFGLRESDDFRQLWNIANPNQDVIYGMAKTLEECGARTYVREQAANFTGQAFNRLDALVSSPNAYFYALTALSERLLERKQ